MNQFFNIFISRKRRFTSVFTALPKSTINVAGYSKTSYAYFYSTLATLCSSVVEELHYFLCLSIVLCLGVKNKQHFEYIWKLLRETVMIISLSLLVSQNQGRLDGRNLWRAWGRKKILKSFTYETWRREIAWKPKV